MGGIRAEGKPNVINNLKVSTQGQKQTDQSRVDPASNKHGD